MSYGETYWREMENASVDEQGWVNLEMWTDRSVKRLPKSIREPDEALTHCSSLVTVLGDPACDPRSGGVAGNVNLAIFYGVKEQQFRRNILPTLDFVRDLKGIPVSNVASMQAHALDYDKQVYTARCDRLGITPDLSRFGTIDLD